MDPLTLSASAVALLVPYAQKAAEEFAGEIGKAVFEKSKSLMAWIKGKLANDPPAANVIDRFEQAPEKYSPFLQDILQERLQADPALSAELARMLEDIKATGPTVGVVLKMKKAESVVGLRVKEMTRGTANVDMDIEEGKGITGAEIDRI